MTNQTQARPQDPSAPTRSALVAQFEQIVMANPLVMLSTISAHGAPMNHCMHFSLNMEGRRPLIYMFTQDGTRKIANINANPRVALSMLSWEQEPRLTVRMRGLAREVFAADEHAYAMAEHCKRPGYEHNAYLTLQYQPALRIDLVSATLFHGTDALNIDFPA